MIKAENKAIYQKLLWLNQPKILWAHSASWLKLATVSGKEITDEAKITAITPL